jgi:exodeoxyribonuclease VIII
MMRVSGVELWGNGSDFDNVILGDAYEAAAMRRPWSYNKSRCFRTALADAPEAERERLWKRYSVGVGHNALDDALRQARILCEYRYGVTSEVI